MDDDPTPLPDDEDVVARRSLHHVRQLTERLDRLTAGHKILHDLVCELLSRVNALEQAKPKAPGKRQQR